MLLRGTTIICTKKVLSEDDLSRIRAYALATSEVPVLTVDLSSVQEASSATFACLVRLRKLLRRLDRDMVITGLNGRAVALHSVMKLQRVLPLG